jgi:hypothetical protein
MPSRLIIAVIRIEDWGEISIGFQIPRPRTWYWAHGSISYPLRPPDDSPSSIAIESFVGFFPVTLSFVAEIDRVRANENRDAIAESGACTDIKRSDRALVLLDMESGLCSSSSEFISFG